MGRPLQPLVLLNQPGRADNLVHEAHLARPATGHAVCPGKSGHLATGIGVLAAVENALPGDKDVIEDDH